jgi:uncharacterized protein YbjT (DUF2867 family)
MTAATPASIPDTFAGDARPLVLVTGATGTVGRALVERLQATGARVIAGSPRGADVAGAPGRRVDFTDPASLDDAFRGVDRLFLLFPLVPGMVAMARAAIDAARAAGVSHVVRSSGAGADAASPVAIARVQGEIDAAVAASGLPFTLLRPANFMQNWVNFFGGAVRDGVVHLPHGEGRVSFVDVRDIADVAAAVLLDPAPHAGRTYTLTGGQALSVPEVLEAIAAAGGRRARYEPVPEAAAVQAMAAMGMDPWTVDVMSSLNQVVAAGWAAGVSPDVQAVTGHAPRAFADFAAANAAAWR